MNFVLQSNIKMSQKMLEVLGGIQPLFATRPAQVHGALKVVVVSHGDWHRHIT